MGLMKDKLYNFISGRYPLALFFLSFAALIYTPIFIIYSGGDTQSLFTLYSFAPALGICFLILALFSTLNHLFPKTIFAIDGILTGAALYLLITVLFFPVHTGVLDGATLSFSKTDKVSHLVLFGLCLAAALIGLCKTQLSLLLRKVVVLLGCFSIIAGIYMGASALPLSNAGIFSQAHWKSVTKLSPHNNIIVVCLDMIQREFAQEYFANSPEAQKLFDGFVFFSNTASASPVTGLSLSTMIRGHLFEGKTTGAPPDDNLLNDMKNYGYEVSTSAKFSERVNGGGPGTEIPEIPMKSFTEQAAAATFLGMSRYLPFKIKTSLAPEKEFGWVSKLDQRNSFKEFISMLHVDNACEKRFIWIHSLQTHAPVRFTSKGKYSRRLGIDDVYGEIADGLNMNGDLIAKLKALGVYDNTMILFISDHGFGPITSMKSLKTEQSYLLYTLSTSQWGKSGREHKHVIGRYEPMIMFKPFATQGSLKYSDSAVSLPDIRKTMNEAVSPGSGAKFEGVNILDYQNLPRERTIPAFIFNKDVFNSSDFFYADNWKIGSIRLPIPENYKQPNNKVVEAKE